MTIDLNTLNQKIQSHSNLVQRIMEGLKTTIIGQQDMLEKIIIGMLADGHILLEGLPGLAKTTAVNALAQVIQSSFKRIQFTPDLLPADLIGTLIYNPKSSTFDIKKGPIFSNIILADEINRSPSKVQSALLEAMQEKQVTIGDTTYKLPPLFLVLASQNPIEQEGTYPLPEAQIDRFMLKVNLTYPSFDEELQIIEAVTANQLKFPKPSITEKEILEVRGIVKEIYIDDKIKEYITHLVHATRTPENYQLQELKQLIQCGSSPRASINLALASKAQAFLRGRSFVTPEDIKEIGFSVLQHRLILSYEAEAENVKPQEIVQQLFDNIEVP